MSVKLPNRGFQFFEKRQFYTKNVILKSHIMVMHGELIYPKIRDLLAETSPELPSIPPKINFERFPSISNFWK